MKKFNLRYSSVALSMAAMTALASNNVYAQEEEFEEIVVTGTRATIQSSIDQKRISTEIVDGLSADEIGDIPALSIGEALETITGASSHRENGGASEVSIRGLGPFLTNTVINGRTATNGAGNRAVNFSIFPSELFNKIGIFKTQSASFIEGAVGGQIRLDTKKPIEHGKQSIQLSLKGAYNENEQDIDGGDDIGYRGTVSYIDQFETENLGTFGVSVGVQLRDETNPEQEYRTSGTPRVCDLDADGIPTTNGSCSDAENFLRGLTPNSDGEFATDEDRETFAFLSSSATFRQNVTSDEREAFFGAVQWQPNDKLDINLDYQYSERDRAEERSDLEFQELNSGLQNENTVVSADGILERFQNEGTDGQEIRLNSQNFDQVEEYQGLGLSLEYQVNDDLKISGDISYSNTLRTEEELALQLGDNGERLVSFDRNGGGVPIIGAFNVDGSAFDPTDINSFINDGVDRSVDGNTNNLTNRQRFRSQIDIRENTITALRGDFELQTADKLGAITSVEGGIRFSELEYSRIGNVTTDVEIDDLNNGQAILDGVSNNCVGLQPESGFLSEELGSRTLGLNFDDFLSIDVDCAFEQAILAGNDADDIFAATDDVNGGSIDVTEDTFAAYLQANYESQLFGLPARGNFGVRLVNTRVDSRTFSTPFNLDVNDNGTFELDAGAGDVVEVSDDHSYTELLPSATLVLDISDNVLLRTGIFRGISRSDPAILGARQEVGTVQQLLLDQTPTGANNDIVSITTEDIQSFLTTQTTTGGAADLDAFTSWNVDLAVEWYPNKDTILSAGVYYKKFRGGFENTVVNSDFVIQSDGSTDTLDALTTTGLFVDGESLNISAPVSGLQTTSESSNLYGIELTASHAFSYLPGFWGGFGGKLSYNYASSDFEFEDDFAGEGVGLANGQEVALIGLIPSADIFGLSRNVASAQLYWSGGAFDFQLIGKHRSQYFQQFVDDPGRLRFVDDTNVLEFRASYKLNDSVKFSFEALNLTDEERTDFRAIDGNVNQVLSFGPRYFFGIKATL